MKKIVFLAISFAILAACTNEVAETPISITKELTFTATQEGLYPESRTVRMDDGTTWWNAKEAISVFYESGSAGGSKFTTQNTTLQDIVEFSGSIQMTGSGKDFWAVYPYSEGNSCDGTSITTVIPEVQKGSEGNFSGDAFPTIATSKTLDLAFWNICGGIKFFVSRTDIQSITVKGNRGEAFAGKVRVAFDADGHPKVTEIIDGKTEVTLVAPDGGSFKPGKYYYVTLLPTALDGGITLTFYTSSEKGEIVSDKAQTVKRSIFGVLKNIDSKVAEWKSTEPEAVDLGLSVKWASFNLGATGPEEYGDYFAWGEVEPKEDYSWSTYKFELGTERQGPFSKYVTNSDYGTVDNKTVLDPEDDAAHVNWGGSWRMPTDEEWTELRTKCTFTWTTQNGVNGRLVTGPNGKSIFLPAAGYRYDTYFTIAGSYGYYWSSSLLTDRPDIAWRVNFDSGSVYRYLYDRCLGLSVRPVYDDRVRVTGISMTPNMTTLAPGEVMTLAISIIPSDATNQNVIWESSNESVAVVDENGKITALAPGTATITVTTEDGGYTATCSVTVEEQSYEFRSYCLEDGSNFNGILNVIHFQYGTKFGSAAYSSFYIVPWNCGEHALVKDTDASHFEATSSKTGAVTVSVEKISNYYAFVVKAVSDPSHSEVYSDLELKYTDVGGTAITKMVRVAIAPSKAASAFQYDLYTYDGTNVNAAGSTYTHVMSKSDASYVRLFTRYKGITAAGSVPDTEEMATYSWSSSNTSVVSVAKKTLESNKAPYPELTFKASGTSTVEYNYTDHKGNKMSKTIEVTVVEDTSHSSVEPKAVDLGLSVKWATYNVGASTPEEYGYYLAWGETDTKNDYSWSTYKWCNGDSNKLTKYCTQSSYWDSSAPMDNKTTLDPEDDAAHVNWGGSWRTPTIYEWQQLIDNCTWTWTWTTQNVANGYLVTGPNGNSIFLPAPGFRYDSDLYEAGFNGRYWSSSLDTVYPSTACYVDFTSGGVSGYNFYRGRHAGLSVRPVCPKD